MQISFDDFNGKHSDLQLQGMYEKEVMIISPVGSIDTYNSTSFDKAVQSVISGLEELPHHVVFNMAGVTYVSSTGIGIFTSLLKFFGDKKIEMHLWRIQDKVFDIFQLLGFTTFIHFIQDLNEIQDGFAERTVEPKLVACPHCGKTIKITKAGKFRCGTCKGILIVNDNMEITRA